MALLLGTLALQQPAVAVAGEETSALGWTAIESDGVESSADDLPCSITSLAWSSLGTLEGASPSTVRDGAHRFRQPALNPLNPRAPPA